MIWLSSVQSSLSVVSKPLSNTMDWSMPGFPVQHQLPELAQTHVHRVGDAIQPYHPLLLPSPPAFNLSQHQGLFQWVRSLFHVAKVLEIQRQSFQWIFMEVWTQSQEKFILIKEIQEGAHGAAGVWARPWRRAGTEDHSRIQLRNCQLWVWVLTSL